MNLSLGKSGKAKHKFVEWLHRGTLSAGDVSQTDYLTSSSSRKLVTRGLRSSHARVRGKLLRTIAGIQCRSSEDKMSTKVPLPPKTLSQQMRKSMKEMWIREPILPSNENRNSISTQSPKTVKKKMNRWNTHVESIRPVTPEQVDRDEYSKYDDKNEMLNGISLKVAVSPAQSIRNNFKFEKKTDILAPVSDVMNDIQIKVRAKVHTSHSPIKSRKLHLIPRVDGSKIYSKLGKEHTLPDGSKVMLYEGDCYAEMVGDPVDDPKEANKLTLLELMKQPFPKIPPPIEHEVNVIRPYSISDPPRPIGFPNKSELMTKKEKSEKIQFFIE